MSTANPEKVIQSARSWIGTPYIHQASVKGAGTDCLGLLRGVWRTLYGSEPEPVPAYSMDWSETQGDERLWRAASRHLSEKPTSECGLGDVLLFRMRSSSVAKHLGIIAATGNHPTFVHAYSHHGVVESPLSLPWQRRIAACFEFPAEIS